MRNKTRKISIFAENITFSTISQPSVSKTDLFTALNGWKLSTRLVASQREISVAEVNEANQKLHDNDK